MASVTKAVVDLARAEICSPTWIQVWSTLVPNVNHFWPRRRLALSLCLMLSLLEHDEAVPPAVDINDGEGTSSSVRVEKLTVVLDLDETLVCGYEASSLPAGLLKQAIEAGITCFDLECVSSEKESEGKPKINCSDSV